MTQSLSQGPTCVWSISSSYRTAGVPGRVIANTRSNLFKSRDVLPPTCGNTCRAKAKGYDTIIYINGKTIANISKQTVQLTVQLVHISSSGACRCVSIASATSWADSTRCEYGRIDLMIASTRVTLAWLELVRGRRMSDVCFTTTILQRRTDTHYLKTLLELHVTTGNKK